MVLALFIVELACVSCYVSSARHQDWNDGDVALPEAHDALEDRVDPSDILPEMPGDIPPEIPADPPMDEEADEAPGITWEEYCLRKYASDCAYYTACCTQEELDHLNMSEGRSCNSPEEDSNYRLCMEIFIENADLFVIDETALEACERAWQEMAGACPGYGYSLAIDREPACWDVLSGILPEGAGCEHSGECMEGLFCHQWDEVCVPRAGLGGVCRENDGCLEGLICYDWHCTEIRGEGEPCDGDRDCLIPLWCDEQVCRALLPSGESCEGVSLGGCEGLCRFPGAVCGDFCDGL